MRAMRHIATLGIGSGHGGHIIAASVASDERRWFSALIDGMLLERDVLTHNERWTRVVAPELGCFDAEFAGADRATLFITHHTEFDEPERFSLDRWNLAALDDGPSRVFEDANVGLGLQIVVAPDRSCIATVAYQLSSAVVFDCNGVERTRFDSITADNTMTPVALLDERSIAFVSEGRIVVVEQRGARRSELRWAATNTASAIYAVSSERVLIVEAAHSDGARSAVQFALCSREGRLIAQWQGEVHHPRAFVTPLERSFVVQCGERLEERSTTDGSLLRTVSTRGEVCACGHESIVAERADGTATTTWSGAARGDWRWEPNRRVEALAWVPDGRTVVSQHNDETLCVWDVDRAERLNEIALPPDGAPWELQQLIEGGTTALCAQTRRDDAHAIIAIDLRDASCVERWRLTLSAPIERIACASDDGSLLIVREFSDPRYDKPLTVVRRAPEGVVTRRFNAGSAQIGVARTVADDGTIGFVLGTKWQRVRVSDECELIVEREQGAIGTSVVHWDDLLINERGVLVWNSAGPPRAPRFYTDGNSEGTTLVDYGSLVSGVLATRAARSAFRADFVGGTFAGYDFDSEQRWEAAIDAASSAPRCASALALAPDGQRLAIGTPRGEILVYALD